jgi:phospholipid-transporting ATPase
MANLDFNALVARANPAAAQYQPTRTHNYPPDSDSRQEIFLIDDDDEEKDFGLGGPGHSPVQPGASFRQAPMASMNSMNSTSPLAANAQQPAGTSMNDGGSSWLDDDAELEELPQQRQKEKLGKRLKERFKFQMPWNKEEKFEGERIILLNDEVGNHAQKFPNNYVSTSKYNVVTFIPKFLAEQFSKYANVFFLFTSLIQQIPGVSPTNRWTTIAPLALVLLASAFKETQEDVKRHQSDAQVNSRKTRVLDRGGNFVDKPWKDIRVGDVVRLESNDFIPADMVVVATSEPEGLCYIETSNLDGYVTLNQLEANDI